MINVSFTDTDDSGGISEGLKTDYYSNSNMVIFSNTEITVCLLFAL